MVEELRWGGWVAPANGDSRVVLLAAAVGDCGGGVASAAAWVASGMRRGGGVGQLIEGGPGGCLREGAGLS